MQGLSSANVRVEVVIYIPSFGKICVDIALQLKIETEANDETSEDEEREDRHEMKKTMEIMMPITTKKKVY